MLKGVISKVVQMTLDSFFKTLWCRSCVVRCDDFLSFHIAFQVTEVVAFQLSETVLEEIAMELDVQGPQREVDDHAGLQQDTVALRFRQAGALASEVLVHLLDYLLEEILLLPLRQILGGESSELHFSVPWG